MTVLWFCGFGVRGVASAARSPPNVGAFGRTRRWFIVQPPDCQTYKKAPALMESRGFFLIWCPETESNCRHGDFQSISRGCLVALMRTYFSL